jgi:murein DD-endopeptidase MepM/ murein hydrolase activator NlpD
MAVTPKRALVATLAAAAIVASPAAASTGGTSPSGSSSGGSSSGGTRPGSPASSPAPPSNTKGGKTRARPTLAAFSLSSTRLYAYGSPVRVSFQIDARRTSIPVTLKLLSAGTVVASTPLGTLPTKTPQSYSLSGDSALPEGPLEVRVSASKLRRGPHASGTKTLFYYSHRLPLAQGSYTLPPGGNFGTSRTGHKHQGQDLSAPQGTPIVAPRGGVVTKVAYQAGGAGYYVVVDGAGEQYDYVFMHLVAGSTRVREGQTVRTGQRLGDVGSTGASSGPHLHFEIWQGTWQAGGKPVDPLPFIKRWQAQR